jgi:Tfp pilus assembly protein PilF
VDLVEGYTALAKDPTAAGVAASLGAKELLEQRPPEQAIAYFEQLLPEVRDDSVRRSVRVQLAELYKKTGQNEKALEQYRILMTEPATRPAADGQ